MDTDAGSVVSCKLTWLFKNIDYYIPVAAYQIQCVFFSISKHYIDISSYPIPDGSSSASAVQVLHGRLQDPMLNLFLVILTQLAALGIVPIFCIR